MCSVTAWGPGLGLYTPAQASAHRIRTLSRNRVLVVGIQPDGHKPLGNACDMWDVLPCDACAPLAVVAINPILS